MNKLIKVVVNGKTVAVKGGSNLLEAFRLRQPPVRVPTLCYHPDYKARAVCRLCLVQVLGWRKPVSACSTKVEDGMHIVTDSDELKKFRRADLEFLLSRHPNECIRCEVSGTCKLQDLVKEHQVEDKWPKSNRGDSAPYPDGSFIPGLETFIDSNNKNIKSHASHHHLEDHTSPSISLDIRKCIDCGLCVDACQSQGPSVLGFVERGFGMTPTTVFDEPLKDIKCISCGQCTLHCPTGAISERPDWHRVMDILDSGRHVTIVQTAPASRVAIGEEFGFEPGRISTGKMINALRALGFSYVFDTCFAADLTIMEETYELLQRQKNKGPLPMFTSCCPAWVNYLELNRPELLKHLSTTKSPQQMHGALTKFGPFRKTLPEGSKPFVVSIMPCTAKKDEAVRPGMRGDVDAVLTTRELARMMRHRNVNFASLNDDGCYDTSLGESSGAAVIFGASGGVLEAALRTLSHLLKIENPKITFEKVRGVKSGIKEASVPGVGKVAAISPMSAAIELLNTDKWKEYLMIEVMACKGGCLGGGGEPKSDDPNVLAKRAKGIYEIDKKHSTIRKSHENREVKVLYDQFLESPGSVKSEELLHTVFAERHSPRDYLLRFLDAVDARDGKKAAALFEPDGCWDTGIPLPPHFNRQLGTCLVGVESIERFINSAKLPPGRHVPVSATCGMVVRGPNGQLSSFQIDINPHTKSIIRLKRNGISEHSQ